MYDGEIEFFDLVKRFTGIGYKLNVHEQDTFSKYLFAVHKGRKIHFGFCNPNPTSFQELNGKIAIDNIKFQNHWPNYIINLPFPKNNIQFDFLCDQMEFLKTRDGIRSSKGYHDGYNIRIEYSKDYGLK